MPLRKGRGKTLLVIFTIVLVIVLPYTQYRVYVNTVKVTRNQLALNAVRGNVIYLAQALSLNPGSIERLKDPQWRNYNKTLHENVAATIADVNRLLPDGYSGKEQLMNAHTAMVQLENEAVLMATSEQTPLAKKLLQSNNYRMAQGHFLTALKKLIQQLDRENDRLFAFLQREAIKNIVVRGLIALMVLLGWFWFSMLRRQWQKKLNELNRQRISEERAGAKQLEEVNGQLRELSLYLQDIQEKERMTLASEINERLGQQMAAIKVKIAEVDREQKTADPFLQKKLEEIASQMNGVIHQMRNLATEVYPLILRDFGLPEALQWESERVTGKSGAVVQFTSGVEDIILDHRTTTTLFRTYQQKLQHCLNQGATEIRSSLHLENDVLFLHIIDDGTLVPGEGNDIMQSMALQERLQGILGHCQTRNIGNEKNCFTVSIPYEKV